MPDASVEPQRALCLGYVQAHGYRIVRTIVDRGLSGMTVERPGLAAVYELVRKGAVDAVIVARRDCLSRRADHLRLLSTECARYGVAIRIVEDDWVTELSAGA